MNYFNYYLKTTFGKSIIALFILSFIGGPAAYAQLDLSVTTTANPASPTTVTPGSDVTFTITVNNEGATAVNGVVLTNTLPTGLTYKSHSVGAGTYTTGTGVWNIGNIASGTSTVTMTLVCTVASNAEGVLTILSEITAMTSGQTDKDSSPNNGTSGTGLFEDDIKYTCVSVPVYYCNGRPVSVTINAMSGFTSYEWYKDGILVSGATTSSYTATSIGSYTYKGIGTSVAPSCEGLVCCPFVIAYRPAVAVAVPDVSICNTASTTLTATPSNGTAPYTYTWSPSTGLSATTGVSVTASPTVTTTYTVTATDVNGCTATDNAIVTVQSRPTVAVTANSTICVNVSVPLDVTVSGGTSPFTYAWSPSSGLSASNVKNPTATPTVTTTYNVTVSDVNGCSNTGAVTITVNPRPTANAGPDVTICAQSSTTLAGSATGGTSPYTYSWTPTTNLSNATIANPVANPTVTTTYTLLVSDANGCTSSDQIVVTVNPRPTVNAGADVSICNTSSTTLTATPSGGTAGYTYLWSPSTGLSATNVASVTASPTVTTTYTVTLTDTRGCTATDAVQVTVQSRPTVAVTANSTICVNVSVPLDVTVSGGTSPFTYAWSPSSGLSASNVKNPTATPTTTTTYTVTVSDVNGCSNTGAVTITVNPRPTANAGTDVTICAQSSTTLAGSATGGTTPYTYSWTPTTNLSNAAIANPVASPTVTTTYTLLVSDANGCTSSDQIVITVNPKPTVNAGADVSICNTSSTTLTATPSGGTAGYTYLWSPSTGLSATNVASVTANPTVTTTYTVTLTDTRGCTATDAVQVTVQSRPTVAVTANSTICVNVSVPLDVTVSGGTSPFTYAWSPSSGLSASNVKNPTATPTVTTTYNVTVSDVNGCSNTGAVTITVNPRPTANAGTDVTICAQSSTTLAGSATGGTTPYTYSWTPTTNLSNAAIANPVASPTVTTTYTLLVSDANGCTSSDQIVITVNPKPTVNAGADVSICNTSSTTLTATPSGGTAGYTYLWSPSTGLSATNVASVTANPTVTTTYTVTLTDTRGCTATDAVQVTVQSRPTVAVTANSTICVNVSVPLDVTVSGGTSPFTYAWSPSSGLSASNVKNPTATPTTTTTYTVTVSDVNGCSNTGAVTITVNPRPTANAGPDVTICAQSSTTLAGSATGGTTPYTYSWTPTTNLSNAAIANPVANPTVTTTYTLLVSDANGCTSSDQIVITVNPKPTVNAGADVSICNTSSTTLTATPSGGTAGYTYLWSPSTGLSATNTASVTASPTVTTTYTVTLTDTRGCTATDAVQVTVQSRPTVAVTGGSSICEGTSVPLDVTVSGGTSPFTYAWSPSSGLSASNVKNPTATPTTTTTYTVTVSDVNGCSNTGNVTLTVTPALSATITPATTICLGSSQALLVTPTGGSGTYTYTWSASSGTAPSSVANPTVSPTVTTTYTVTISSGSCTIVRSVVITVVTAGTATNPPNICTGNVVTNLDLFGQLTGETLGGTWSQISGTSVGTALNATTGIFNPSGIAAGTYVFRYTIASCTRDVTVVLEFCCPAPVCLPIQSFTRN